MRAMIALVLVLGGCMRANPLLIDGDGGTGCAAYTDRASCEADARCLVAGCRQCDGSTSFVACYDQHDKPPAVTCPAIACACQGLDEPECKARPYCRANYCPTCNGGSVYSQCSAAGAPPIACGAQPCPLACDQIGTLDGCNARPDCHAVFLPAACECLNCCCTPFNRCASGGTAASQ